MTNRMDLFDRSRREASGGGGPGPAVGSSSVPGPGHGAGRPVGSASAEAAAQRLAGHLAERLGGERIREGRRSVLKVTAVIPRGVTHGAVPLAPAGRVDESALRVLFPRAAERVDAEGNFVFFDIETTGLSGGAGTLVFLAGTLRLSGGGVLLTQYFLENISSEKLFLSLLSEELGSGSVLVSFNGRSFDANIIRNRLVLNGFRPPDPGPAHLDLLYPSRRIWKERLPDFTLQTLESRILGVTRVGDVPGYRIPEVYFDYLGARGPGEEILSVFAHNRTDTLSLLALFTKQIGIVGDLIEKGEGASRPERTRSSFNPGTLSEMLARGSFGAEARSLLAAHPEDPESLRRLAFLCKKEKLLEGASEAFRTFVEKADCSGPRGLFAFVEACSELSKLFEHGLRNYAEGKRYAELALGKLERAALFFPAGGGGPDRGKLARESDALRKRLVRLNRRLGPR